MVQIIKRVLIALIFVMFIVTCGKSEAEKHLENAEKFFELKVFKKAIEEYSKAINLDPMLANAYSGRGNSYDSIYNQRYEEYFQNKAIEDYTIGIKLDPKNAKTYYSRGVLVPGDKDALRDFHKAVEIGLRTSDVYNDLGDLYLKKKKYKKAINNFSKAIELDPSFEWAYTGRGESYKAIKKYKNAIKDFNTYLKLVEKKGYNNKTIRDAVKKMGGTPKY